VVQLLGAAPPPTRPGAAAASYLPSTAALNGNPKARATRLGVAETLGVYILRMESHKRFCMAGISVWSKYSRGRVCDKYREANSLAGPTTQILLRRRHS